MIIIIILIIILIITANYNKTHRVRYKDRGRSNYTIEKKFRK